MRFIVKQACCPRHYGQGLLILAVLAAGARADSLDAIFARMDEASKKLKFVSATLHQTEYLAVIDEKTDENGQLWMKRGKNGMSLLVKFSPPNERVVALDGHTLWIYKPKGNMAEKHDMPAPYCSACTSCGSTLYLQTF